MWFRAAIDEIFPTPPFSAPTISLLRGSRALKSVQGVCDNPDNYGSQMTLAWRRKALQASTKVADSRWRVETSIERPLARGGLPSFALLVVVVLTARDYGNTQYTNYLHTRRIEP